MPHPIPEMDDPRYAHGYSVDFRQTAIDQRELWPQKRTWKPTLRLVQAMANTFGTSDLIKGSNTRPGAPIVPGTSGGMTIEVACTHAIHAAIRHYLYAHKPLSIVQRDYTKQPRRRIVVSRSDDGREAGTPVELLNSLLTALQSGSDYKLEAAYFRLTDAAWRALATGFDRAVQARALGNVGSERVASGEIIQRRILSPDLLAIILPFAIAHARPGHPPDIARDDLIAQLFVVFAHITARPTTERMAYTPKGPAMQFVRGIGEIFGLDVLNNLTDDSVRKARAHMAKMYR